jgi:hypothetical protein
MKRTLALCGLLVSSGAACSSDTDGFVLANTDISIFQREVYPVLLRDCGFPTCHGSAERQFRVWGPGRVRLDPNDPLFDSKMGSGGDMQQAQEPSQGELNLTFASANGFVDAREPQRSLILRKPLATAAGGSGHLGVDRFGRNVYSSMDSDGYLALSSWVFSLKKD